MWHRACRRRSDAARLIEATRQYIHDVDEAVASSSGGEEVVSKMTAKYPDLGNPYTLQLAAYTHPCGDNYSPLPLFPNHAP